MNFFIQTLPNANISFKMIKVEGGVFEMGEDDWDEDLLPAHEVELSDYWMAEHLVTQELWEAVMGEEKNESYFIGKRRPVERVSWQQINDEFLPALNKLTGDKRPPQTLFHLPTEAQWEYAARGGRMNKGFDFSGANKLDDVGWYKENSHKETKPVGLKLPNELGLYDMCGNVWEWCRDFYRHDYYAKCKQDGMVKDPEGPEEGVPRIMRGGAWDSNARYGRINDRFIYNPADSYFILGFRLVMITLTTE